MATQTVFRTNHAGMLRTVLHANAAFSLLSGITGIVAAGPLAAFMGIDAPAVLGGLGVVLILYAGWLLYQTAQETIDRRVVLTAIILDALWVVDSVAILLIGWPPLTVAGKWTVAILALIVAGFAEAQYIGLRQMDRRSVR